MARRIATPANPPANPYIRHTSDVCEFCGEPVFYNIGRPGRWVHSGNYKIRCQHEQENRAGDLRTLEPPGRVNP
jgi:hypothetical protein